MPRLVDSVQVDSARTLGDVAGQRRRLLLIVATEASGSLVVYSLSDPRQPALVTRFTSRSRSPGVHTAQIGRVNGRLYGFLCIDPGGRRRPGSSIVDLSDPAAPQPVFSADHRAPVRARHVRARRLLFLGALERRRRRSGTSAAVGAAARRRAPVELGRRADRERRGAQHLVVQGPGTGGAKATPSSARRARASSASVVAGRHPRRGRQRHGGAARGGRSTRVPGAGTHNFSVDEPTRHPLRGLLQRRRARARRPRRSWGRVRDAAEVHSRRRNHAALRPHARWGASSASGLTDRANPVYIWGVQYLAGAVYASDMLNGLWKLRAVSRP